MGLGGDYALSVNCARRTSACLLWGPVTTDPRLPVAVQRLLNLVITRGTPPRLEGCRPASRGFALALMTETRVSHRRQGVTNRQSGASATPGHA